MNTKLVEFQQSLTDPNEKQAFENGKLDRTNKTIRPLTNYSAKERVAYAMAYYTEDDVYDYERK